jgi:hypothetical protein
MSDPKCSVGRDVPRLPANQASNMAVCLVPRDGGQLAVANALDDHQPRELLVVSQDHRHLLR